MTLTCRVVAGPRRRPLQLQPKSQQPSAAGRRQQQRRNQKQQQRTVMRVMRMGQRQRHPLLRSVVGVQRREQH